MNALIVLSSFLVTSAYIIIISFNTKYVYKGQGSQYVGMGKDLYNLYPRSAKLVFDEADEALGNGLRSLIFDGQQVKNEKSE